MRKVRIKSWLMMFLIVLVALFSFSSELVLAVETHPSYGFCFGSGFYSVQWDTTKATEVKKELITEDSVKRGYVVDVTGMSEVDKAKYKITVNQLSSTCYISGGEAYTCPTSEEKDLYSSYNILETDENYEYVNIDMAMDFNSGLFTVKVKDIFDDNVKVRLVRSGDTPNNRYTKSYELVNPYFLTSSGGYYTITGVAPSTEDKVNYLHLEFYMDNPSSPCNGMFLSEGKIAIETTASGQIANPALANPTAYGCDKVSDYINKVVGLTDDGKYMVYELEDVSKSDLAASLRARYSPMCFKKQTLNYQEYSNLKPTIEADLQLLKEVFSLTGDNANSPLSTSGLKCDDASGSTGWNSSERVVAEGRGSYWAYVCKERYDINFDNAKIVRAGQGFSYHADFTTTRTCSLRQISSVSMKAQCQHSSEVICHYPSLGITMTGHAGPNEDFDACVNKCDGGKYTQACINSCYSEVYGKEKPRDISKLDELLEKEKSFLEDNFNIEQMSRVPLYESSNPDAYSGTYVGYDNVGGGGHTNNYSATVGGVTYNVLVSEACVGNGVNCYVEFHTGPSGCSENPQADYNNESAASAAELSNFSAKMSDAIGAGNYTIKIADSYLHENNVAYTYEVSGNDIITDNGSTTGSCDWQNLTLGSQGNTARGCKTSSYSRTVKVELTNAYLNKITGNAIYSKNGRYQWFNPKTPSTKLELYTDFDSKAFYKKARKYYTSILSLDTNVKYLKNTITGNLKPALIDDNTYFSQSTKQANIVVNVSGMGTDGRFSKQLNCYYGVYPDNCPECEPCVGDECSKSDPPYELCTGSNCGGINCTPGSDCQISDDTSIGSGITFIYRPIELTDVFPNERNPRWNWTNGSKTSSSLLKYEIDPVALTENIEDKGYSVYTDSKEVDYEIILTPQQIQNIRRYNKDTAGKTDINGDGEWNYLDYDMDCLTKNGRDYCTSKFLDNSNYVSYGNNHSATSRKDIAICNNAYSGGCVNDGGRS